MRFMALISVLALAGCDPSISDDGDTDIVDTDTDTDTDSDTDSDTDTDTDTDSDSDTDTFDSEFPDEYSEFSDRYKGAADAPIDESTENTTVVALMIGGMAPIFEVQGRVEEAEAAGETLTCPQVDGEFPEDGLPTEDIVVTGDGCVDENGVKWDGSFIYNGEGVRYTDWRVTTPVEGCEGKSRSVLSRGGVYLEPGLFIPSGAELMYIYLADEVDQTDCTESTTDIAYSGALTIEADFSGDTTINGSAKVVGAEAGVDFKVDVSTKDEVFGDACSSEPLSGTNTLSNASGKVEFTFDGAKDCDESPTQMRSINGGDEQEVDGVSCNTASGPMSMAWMLGLLALLPLRRRR